MRIGLLASNLRAMHLTITSGTAMLRGGRALLNSAANDRLLQLIAKVFILLFTTSTLVRAPLGWS